MTTVKTFGKEYVGHCEKLNGNVSIGVHMFEKITDGFSRLGVWGFECPIKEECEFAYKDQCTVYQEFLLTIYKS